MFISGRSKILGRPDLSFKAANILQLNVNKRIVAFYVIFPKYIFAKTGIQITKQVTFTRGDERSLIEWKSYNILL